MARKQVIESMELSSRMNGAKHFWNTSHRVGYGCENYWTDVLLVQFLLNAVWRAYIKAEHPGVGNQLLIPDGKFGGKTWGRIKHFQSKNQLVKDGTISKADGSRVTTPKHGRNYTMHILNAEYSFFYSSYFNDLRLDPKLPIDLCSLISGPGAELD